MPKSTKVASKPLDVLLVSDIRADLVLTGNTRPKFQQIAQIVSGYSLELGGSASIVASQLAKLGAQVGVLGYVGADTVGDLALQELDQIGVDITRIKRHPSVKTGVGIHFAERNDRCHIDVFGLTYLGSIDATCSKDLDDALLDSCRHWHLTDFALFGLTG